MRARWIAIAVVLAGGASIFAWGTLRSSEMDLPYDDDREARRLANLPLQIPKDVDLPMARTKDDVDPLLVDVSLGRSSIRIRDRHVIDVPAEAGVPMPIGDALAWSKKVADFADASPVVANVLIDRAAPYHLVFPFLFTVTQAPFDVRFVVKRHDGTLGTIPLLTGKRTVGTLEIDIATDGFVKLRGCDEDWKTKTCLSGDVATIHPSPNTSFDLVLEVYAIVLAADIIPQLASSR